MMSKISLQRAIIGVVGGIILALVVALFLSIFHVEITIVSAFMGGIFAVQIGGGDRKRSLALGALVGLFYGLYVVVGSFIFSGFLDMFGISTVPYIISGLGILILVGAIAGLIAYQVFKRNSEQLAETPLPLFQDMWQKRKSE